MCCHVIKVTDKTHRKMEMFMMWDFRVSLVLSRSNWYERLLVRATLSGTFHSLLPESGLVRSSKALSSSTHELFVKVENDSGIIPHKMSSGRINNHSPH